MITGVLALIAALIAARISRQQVKAAHAQINADKDQQQKDRAGRLRAARASLPATLSAICDFAERAARALNDQWPAHAILYPDDNNVFDDGDVIVVMPDFPESAIPVLERIVELTDNEAVSERIESILRETQVLMARTRPLRVGGRANVHSLATYILQAAAVYARAESLFGYARRQSEAIDAEPLWDRVSVALTAASVHRDYIEELMASERESGLPPGEADTRPV